MTLRRGAGDLECFQAWQQLLEHDAEFLFRQVVIDSPRHEDP